MNSRHWIITALMGVYPAPWRREYGAELEDVLLARPLTAGTVADVFWNGVRQRLRTIEPATMLGLMMMAVVVGAYSFTARPALQPTGITWPPLVVSVLNPSTELYAALLMMCGAWTQLKYCDRIWRSATAAMKVTFFGGIPVMLAGVLMFAGVGNEPPSIAFATLVAPISTLPYSGLWGAVGGSIGRQISYLLSYLRRRFARS